jgi:hypothetical protein
MEANGEVLVTAGAVGCEEDACAWLPIIPTLANAAITEAAIASLPLLFISCLPFVVFL